MKIEVWNLDRIRPYPNNPRINDDAVDAVAASIREFGVRQAIVVDTDGVIGELHVVQRLQLSTRVGQQCFLRIQVGPELVTLILQINDQFTLEVAFALVAFGNLPFPDVLFQDDEVVGFSDGFVFSHASPAVKNRGRDPW